MARWFLLQGVAVLAGNDAVGANHDSPLQSDRVRRERAVGRVGVGDVGSAGGVGDAAQATGKGVSEHVPCRRARS